MASEDGAGIVSNVRCDVNITIDRTAESAGERATDTTSSGTSRRTVVGRTADRASDSARNSSRTPTGIPAAASPSHANTEEHASRKNSGPSACASGDVQEQAETDNDTHQPSLQRRAMSHQRTDLDSGACLPGEPDGNPASCHPVSRAFVVP